MKSQPILITHLKTNQLHIESVHWCADVNKNFTKLAISQ